MLTPTKYLYAESILLLPIVGEKIKAGECEQLTPHFGTDRTWMSRCCLTNVDALLCLTFGFWLTNLRLFRDSGSLCLSAFFKDTYVESEEVQESLSMSWYFVSTAQLFKAFAMIAIWRIVDILMKTIMLPCYKSC
jgi:hypothetical protein